MSKFLDINNSEIEGMFLKKGVPSDWLTADEKKRLYDFMIAQGLPMQTCYRRFFDKGFDLWEIKGIDALKEQFLNEAVPCSDEELEQMPEEERESFRAEHEGDRGYLAILALGDDVNMQEGGEFYQFLKQHHYATLFRRWMVDKGMSWITCGRRFIEDDWKPWERKGIKTVLADFLDEEAYRASNI